MMEIQAEGSHRHELGGSARRAVVPAFGHAEMLDASNRAAHHLGAILRGVIQRLAESWKGAD